MVRVLSLLVLAVMAGSAAQPGGHATCMGGTIASIRSGTSGQLVTDAPNAFLFVASSTTVTIPYNKINMLEYGQDVGRRVLLAWAVSPVFLLMKARAHYLTVGFIDADDHQQTLVFRLDKRIVRSTLATLEARSGRNLTYQDPDARKSHRGG